MTQPVEFLYVVPVGAVIAWYPPTAATALPPCFVVCDGRTISDPDSLFNQRQVPDLTHQFILGTVPGQTALGTVTGNSGINLNGWSNADPIVTGSTAASQSDVTNNNIVQGTSPSVSWRYVLDADLSIKDGNHHHAIGSNSIQIDAPGSVALYYIIRIK